jgi:hypothetical protein
MFGDVVLRRLRWVLAVCGPEAKRSHFGYGRWRLTEGGFVSVARHDPHQCEKDDPKGNE